MVEIKKPQAFVRQIVLYLKNEDYKKAYQLAQGFVSNFPDEMFAHFLLAKAAFWMERYDECISEGRRAFNLAGKEDMAIIAVLMGSAYFKAGRYREGYVFLSSVRELKDNTDIQTLLFLFSYAQKDRTSALAHADLLYRMDQRAAITLIEKFAK